MVVFALRLALITVHLRAWNGEPSRHSTRRQGEKPPVVTEIVAARSYVFITFLQAEETDESWVT